MKNKKTLALTLATLIIGTSLGVQTALAQQAVPQTMKYIPPEGLNVDWPILRDDQYFSYKGRTSSVVTLRSLMAFDAQKIMDLYDEDPRLALDDIILLVLVQFAMRGVDVQNMTVKKREDLAKADISKRLRQFGRIAELKALHQVPSIVPSIAALVHIVEEIKEDIKRQKYHTTRNWDRNKISAG